MKTDSDPLRSLTAANLMRRNVMHVPEDTEMCDAARTLSLAHVSGAPVVGAWGQCVGVLSTSDFVLLACEGGAAAPAAPALPLTCGFQAKQPGPGGAEVTFCTLPADTCPFQRKLPGARAGDRAVCSEPHCVPTDWQVVNLEQPPTSAVRRSMSPPPSTTEPESPVAVLAWQMSDAHIHRLIVVDEQPRPRMG